MNTLFLIGRIPCVFLGPSKGVNLRGRCGVIPQCKWMHKLAPSFMTKVLGNFLTNTHLRFKKPTFACLVTTLTPVLKRRIHNQQIKFSRWWYRSRNGPGSWNPCWLSKGHCWDIFGFSSRERTQDKWALFSRDRIYASLPDWLWDAQLIVMKISHVHVEQCNEFYHKLCKQGQPLRHAEDFGGLRGLAEFVFTCKWAIITATQFTDNCQCESDLHPCVTII